MRRWCRCATGRSFTPWFRPGHRIIVHVQSGLFPLHEPKPQSWVAVVFDAEPGDYVRATQTMYRGGDAAGAVWLPVADDCASAGKGEAMDVDKYGPWALIVGGSEGVGAAFARLLAADGFKLVLVARKPAPLEELAAELRASGAEVRIRAADLSKPDVLDRVREVTDDVGVGLLVYNAGANDTRGNFLELPRAVPDAVIAINVLGQTEFARHYGAPMAKRGRGGIILTGSLGGYLGSATLAAYTAAKAFSRVFTEALWAECQPFGVDVLHLNIGFTATPAMARLGLPVEYAEAPETVAREGLDNIANGPTWIVSTPGNLEQARRTSVVDDRADTIRAYSIGPREETGKPATQTGTLADGP